MKNIKLVPVILFIVLLIFIITLKHDEDNSEISAALEAEAESNSPECQYEAKPIDQDTTITMEEALEGAAKSRKCWEAKIRYIEANK